MHLPTSTGMDQLDIITTVYPDVLAQIIIGYMEKSLYVTSICDETNTLTLSYYNTEWNHITQIRLPHYVRLNVKISGRYMYYPNPIENQIICHDLILQEKIILPPCDDNMELCVVNKNMFLLTANVELYRLTPQCVDTTWVKCAQLEQRQDYSKIQVLDQHIYVIVRTDSYHRMLCEYNTITDTWSTFKLPGHVSSCYEIVVLNNTLYVITTIPRGYVYRLDKNKFIRVGPIKLPGCVMEVCGFNNRIHFILYILDEGRFWLEYDLITHEVHSMSIPMMNLGWAIF